MNPVYALAALVGLGMWSGLARALIGSPVYAAGLDIAVVFLLGLAVWDAHRRGFTSRPAAIDVLVAAFVAIAFIEIFNPNVPSPMVGLEGFRKTAFMAAGYAIARLSPPVSNERFLRLVLILTIPALVWAIRQFFAPIALELAIMSTSGTSSTSFHSGTVLRAFAPTASPFHLGILAGTFVIGASILAGAIKRRDRWIAAAILAAIALGLSLTRANLLATVFALVALAVISIVTLRRFRPLVIAVGISSIAIVVALNAAASRPPYVVPGSASPFPSSASTAPGGSPRAASPASVTPPPIRIPELLEDRSLKFRFQFWRDQLGAVAQRPLVGFGTSSAADGFDRLYAGTRSLNFEPHSIYTKILLEQGVIGFLIFACLLATLLLMALRAVFRRGPEALFATWVLGILLLVGVSGLTGPMLDAYPFNLLFWASAGLLVQSEGSKSADPAAKR